ncbi:MraY family glycosyltransferase [Sphingobacterium corticibacter]|uniref:UDP-GlcNAc--UDP-phosphate GlcNAc-1-phosphate transferase n=1 Tax=Sphingobacterium corticibacter TaxID=2171749 RepID=A0A2T8HJI4_9SPHI|nr:glycosyltransferase family 4 protein [Sphingobacterium corticibacter]PVH25601.1 UDP-GlcNAc--UDP-phosphate GlcNAc-1-phosphate transferase [Sphingobacterium corticibacter]
MHYILLLAAFILFELFYFRIADHFNIIDKPNERSSHTEITLRGGGIVFYFAALIYFIVSGFSYPWFFLGLTLMTVVSFADDLLTLSNKLRLLIHFLSVLLMSYELDLFAMPWFYLLSTFVLVVGVINAYNFMDGINGITAAYSLAVGGLLMLVNSTVGFIDPDLLSYTMLGVLAFAFFNFRKKAKCFAGDVGSVAIAFILMFALAKLILQTGNFLYILFLGIYGIDAVWTIVRRLYLKENIFQAHRSHLYQYLANEAGVPKLLVSAIYGILQFVFGMLVIYATNFDVKAQILFSVVSLLVLSIVYLLLKESILKKHIRSNQQTS